jgi:membrane-associated phospholipid phosphatase
MVEYTLFWQILSYFGDVYFWLGVATASLLIYNFLPKKFRHYLHWLFFGILPAVIISYFLTLVLKFVLKIPRPCEGFMCPTDYSFPSGHATVIFAASTLLFFLSKDVKLKIFYILFASLVAASRIFLGFHRIEDVVVGAAIGVIIGLITYQNHKDLINFAHKKLKLE